MYIEPNTNIKLLNNVPLDTTYEHTIYFADTTAQYNYFAGLAKYSLTDQSYQRVQRGYMRVNIQAENLYDCNYLMFQNATFGTRWFYAFITSVEYVNNTVSEIRFELDVMQSWFFDYTLGQCFVEREHSATDVIGDNRVPENLDTGDYIYDFLGHDGYFNNYMIVIAATIDENLDDVAGTLQGGLYSGITFNLFESYSSANAFISAAVEANKADAIVNIFECPSAFALDQSGGTPTAQNVSFPKNNTALGSYTPKNKKLFTYPYNMLYVTNNNGQTNNFPYEDFTTSNCLFTERCTLTCNPEAVIYPLNYKGVAVNYNEKMSSTDFPQCAYNTDSFKAWLAQQGGFIPSALNVLGATASGALRGGLTGAITSGVGTLISEVTGKVSTGYIASTEPAQAHNATTTNVNASLGRQGFDFYECHVRPEFAMIIDDYFSKFGYATHRVKIPNRNVRPYWTYTKTLGCIIKGSIPADDAASICAIYDRGVTFWKNGANIGNYSLDNSV